jgi:hypothetical protein
MVARWKGQRIMRGKPQAQPEFLTTINLNQRVPADHPLRGIKERVDKVLVKLSPLFEELYADQGRPSIPPEQLFKSRILMALYSVRSERLFCEQLAYNLLWLWFLDRELEEGSGWNNLASYPVGQPLVVPCGQTAAAQNQLPISTGPQLQFSFLPYGTSGLGVNLSGTGGFILNTTSFQPLSHAQATVGGAAPLDSSSTNATGTPSWLAVDVTITNPVNFVQFSSTFTDTNAGQGLLTVYWNTNQIGTVDERVVSPNVQTYSFNLPTTVTSGLYVLGFRLDVFNNTSSSIVVTNVATGFTGVTQPTALGISLNINGTPVLQLTGVSNYTYLVQSSTDMVNWAPSGLVAMPLTNRREECVPTPCE